MIKWAGIKTCLLITAKKEIIILYVKNLKYGKQKG